MAAKTHADIALAFFLEERTPAQVAKLLNISNATLRRWIKNRVPPKEGERLAKIYRSVHAFDLMEPLMYDAQDCVSHTTKEIPTVRVVRNQDNTIDAQLTVYDIPRGIDPIDVLRDLGDCADAVRNADGWMQLGIRWGAIGSDKSPESGDRRVRGLAEATTYWYTTFRYADCFVYMADIMKRVSDKRHNRKIELLFIRVHWNDGGKAPPR